MFDHIYVQSFGPGTSGVHCEVMSASQGPMGDTTWCNSIIADVESTGGLMWDNSQNTSSHLYVYGNVFYQPSGSSWGVANGVIGGWTGGNGEMMYNVLVYNNTFINVNQESLSSFPNTYGGCQAYNNLWYNCQAPGFSRFPTHDFNDFISSGGTQGEAHGISGSSNPFANFIGLDFTVTANTTAGINLGSPYNIDPAGKTRSTWTRGAYEFATANTNPVIAVSPSSLNFGSIPTNTASQLSFTVRNSNAGILAGTASVAAPFSIVSGGSYSLAANQSQSVTVSYNPTATGTNSQVVTFSGGGGASATVIGVATVNSSRAQLPSPPQNLRRL